ncbi:MAG: arginyltransferase [Methylophilaceae bacterium]|nr:arginyltransferase [Methylophilaceae bacterium]
MTRPNDLPLQRLKFYVTTDYPCGYLEGRQARSLVASPTHLIDTATYSELVRLGFRRSGLYTYRPHCENCQACVPVRLRVYDFTPNRSQRRAWKRHSNLTVHVGPALFDKEHYDLYRHYQKARHAGGGMDSEDVGQYRSFLVQSQVDTALVEFREADELRMVSVVDMLQDGISAVYAFYDCSHPQSSYGTYNILWLVEWCRRQGLPYLYLGYWIAQSRKMAYKAQFRPLERLVDDTWQRWETVSPADVL